MMEKCALQIYEARLLKQREILRLKEDEVAWNRAVAMSSI